MKQYVRFTKIIELSGGENLHIRYMIAFGIGLLVGYKIIPPNIVAILDIGILVICLFKCFGKDVEGLFTWVPYAMFTEIYVRKKAMWLPYLSMQYFLIAAFAILIIMGARGKKLHFRGIFIFVAFLMLEVVNNVYPNKVVTSRAIILNSFAVFLPILWASFTVIKSSQILKLLTHLKIAGIYLAGIVVVAHLTGGIDYGHQSSSDASNGLAPVQMSGYLGLVCILFFLSIMNNEESYYQWLNIGLLAMVTIILMLTFSRGGIYFVAAIIATYFFYNRSKIGSYFKFLVLIPIGAIVYYSVVKTTGGKIVERYELEGSSGRDVLVKVAFILFSQNLVIGVGTGNFNTEIYKQNLYPVESGAHNEFARVAAEHGIIGIFIYWGFFGFLFLDILKRKQPQKQYAMYFLILYCLITVHNGLKISVQPIVLMLAVGTTSIARVKTRSNAAIYDAAAIT